VLSLLAPLEYVNMDVGIGSSVVTFFPKKVTVPIDGDVIPN
jgi:hypothetical protein